MLLASLKLRKYREREGLVLVEGRRALSQAIRYGARVAFAFFDVNRQTPEDTELIALLRQQDAALFVVSDRVMRRVATTETSPGVVAAVHQVQSHPPLTSRDLERVQRIIVLDRLQDPGNVGTIIRSAAAVLTDLVVLTSGTVDPGNPKVIRASAGAYFGIPVIAGVRVDPFTQMLRDADIVTVAADASAKLSAFDFDWSQRHALVIGSEAHGIDPGLEADKTVSLPMPGKTESLNAAMTATVLLYEGWRRGGESYARQ